MLSRIFCTMALLSGLVLFMAPLITKVAVAAALLALSLWHPLFRHPRVWLMLVLALSIGVGRAYLDEARWSSGEALGRARSVCGSVMDSPRQWGTSVVFFLSVSSVDGVALHPPVIILVRWSGCQDTVEPGDRWEFSGRLSPGEDSPYPGGFSQRFWLWTQRAHGILRVTKYSRVGYLGPALGYSPSALAARLRQSMTDRLSQGVRDPVGRALVAGVVFGDTQALPKEVQEQFRRTGTSHLLAASGMNVALLIGLFAGVAKLLGYGPWRIAPYLIPLVVGYAFLAGCAPSITRAAASAVMGLLAAWLGRSSGSWNSLCLSIWVLLLWEPRQIYDLGFQLSLAAVVGLIAGPSLDESGLAGPRPASGLKKSALMTVSASLLTLPFMWSTFHEVSLTLLPANLVLGPLVELLFPLGLLLTLLPFQPLYWAVETVARLSLSLVKLLSMLAEPAPLAHPDPRCSAILAVAICLWLSHIGRARWLALPLASVALLLGQWLGHRPLAGPGELVVRVVSSGEQPIYWLSSSREELLLISEPWQEGRARAMLLDLGCVRPVQLKLLLPGEPFAVRWGAFRWGKVHPLLPKAPYMEVRTGGCTYTVRSWRPEDESRDFPI